MNKIIFAIGLIVLSSSWVFAETLKCFPTNGFYNDKYHFMKIDTHKMLFEAKVELKVSPSFLKVTHINAEAIGCKAPHMNLTLPHPQMRISRIFNHVDINLHQYRHQTPLGNYGFAIDTPMDISEINSVSDFFPPPMKNSNNATLTFDIDACQFEDANGKGFVGIEYIGLKCELTH